MPCEERGRLELEYQKASAVFDAARRELQTKIGTVSKKDYRAISRAADQAWSALQKVHAALDAHIQQHSCLS